MPDLPPCPTIALPVVKPDLIAQVDLRTRHGIDAAKARPRQEISGIVASPPHNRVGASTKSARWRACRDIRESVDLAFGGTTHVSHLTRPVEMRG